MRIAVTQEVPRRACPLGHGVGFSFRFSAALRTGRVDPVGHLRKRRFASFRRLIAFHHRKLQRQFAFVKRYHAALFAVHDRDRLTPISLTGENPVTKLIVCLALALALFRQPFGDFHLRFLNGKTGQKAGIDHHAGGAVGESGFFDVAALDDFNNRQTKLLGKLPVTGIVSGNRHDSTCAVGDKNVVGNENRNFRTVYGVDGIHAVKTHAGLVLVDLGTLKVGLSCRRRLIFTNLVKIFDFIRPLFDCRMFGRNNHIGCAEQRVGTGCINSKRVASRCGEINLGTGGLADPVFLLKLDSFDEIKVIKVVKQPFGIGGDFQHPLALCLMYDLTAAAFADAVDDLFIGKHALTRGAPVDRHFLFICKTLFEHLQENPLSPFIIRRVGRVNLTAPVERKAERLQLLFEVSDVVLRDNLGVDMVLDGVVFRRKSESVPTDGIQDVIALKALFSCDNVKRRVRSRVADMKSLTRRIRELNQAVILRKRKVLLCVENAAFLPFVLPLFFCLFKIVIQVLSLRIYLQKNLFRNNIGKVNIFCIRPQPFKVVVFTAFARKNMDNDCAVIKHNPARRLALYVVRLNTELRHFILQLVRKGFYMGVRRTRCDNKIVGNDGIIGDMNGFQVNSLFLV